MFLNFKIYFSSTLGSLYLLTKINFRDKILIISELLIRATFSAGMPYNELFQFNFDLEWRTISPLWSGSNVSDTDDSKIFRSLEEIFSSYEGSILSL